MRKAGLGPQMPVRQRLGVSAADVKGHEETQTLDV